MTWFQKILVAVPYLLYGTFFYLIFDGFGTTTFVDVLGFVFIVGFIFIAIPALVGFFIYMLFYQKVSFTGGFIISHWLFLLVVFAWFTTSVVSNYFKREVRIVEPGFQPVYSGEKLEIERIAKDHVRNTELQDQSHVYYFLRMIKDTTTIETYTAYYFYNLSDKSDTAEAGAIKMRVNASGMVSFVERLDVKEDKIANGMFHNYYGFYEWLSDITERADGNAGTILSLLESDSVNINKWLKELDVTDTEFSIR